MPIKIIEKPNIYLTREEYDQLFYEYQRSFTHYAGPIPSFETWLIRKRNKEGRLNGKFNHVGSNCTS